MLIEIIGSILLGILAGTITGLIPGIHINLIGISLVSLIGTITLKIPPIDLGIFITSMAIAHTFLDFIPSILLGCPDTDTELSILPGHNLLKKGLGYEALQLTNYGSLAAIFILLIILYPSMILIEKVYPLIKTIIPYLLIATSIFLILSERKKFLALKIFFLTGALGYLTSLLNLNQPLLPLLTGLFGSSLIIKSIKNKTKIPPQKITSPKTNLFRPLLGATIAAPLCSFLPGLGSGQAAIIGNSISRQDPKSFLILLGATNTLVMAFSFIAFYAISRTRTGATVAIKEILPSLSPQIFTLLIITIFLSGITSFFITKKLSLISIKKLQKINYKKLSIGILILLTLIILFVSGLKGILILILSTLTGIYSLNTPVKKTNMMGCLIIPTIIFYLF